jgi:CoA:oxalate CoA-transferase
VSDTIAGPLDGVTVLDLTHALSGPYCTLMLSDLGARVVKVERAPLGDPSRAWAPNVDGVEVYFQAVNRGKESIALDLDAPADRPVLEALVARADVVVENFRPGTLERHGLGYDSLRAINPRVILASISGYGQTGPDHWEGAYDTVIQGVSGLMSMTGQPGSPPTKAGTTVADYLTGIYMFGAISAALYGRERSGEGAHIDVAMHDAVLSIMGSAMFTYLAEGRVPAKTGNVSTITAPFDALEAADGSITICSADDASFARLCDALGRPELARDPRYATGSDRLAHYDSLRPALVDALGAGTVAEWIDRLQHAGVPSGPINSLAQALEDAQTYERNMVVAVGEQRYPGNPIKMTTLDDPVERAAGPELDRDGRAIRVELGLEPDASS